MNYDEEVFINQFPIVKYFIYHLVYSRVLRGGYQKSQLRDEFWTLTIDAHLIRATINWCMVFGNGREQTHWKHLVKQSESHIRTFREGLFRKTALDEAGWKSYWNRMVTFRDKWVAHRELEPIQEPVPNFDIALAVAYHYDDWARDVISPAFCDEPPFHQFTKSLAQSVTPLVNRLLRATNEPGNVVPVKS